MQQEPIPRLVHRYKNAAEAHARATESGDHKTANQNYDAISTVYREVRRRGLTAQRQFLPLLDRKQLFESSSSRRPICAHDPRASFITVALANGRTETSVMDCMAHESSTMINRYRWAACSLAELRAGDLTPLELAIPHPSATAKQARKRAQTVGQEGLEPSANGLRVRCSTN